MVNKLFAFVNAATFTRRAINEICVTLFLKKGAFNFHLLTKITLYRISNREEHLLQFIKISHRWQNWGQSTLSKCHIWLFLSANCSLVFVILQYFKFNIRVSFSNNVQLRWNSWYNMYIYLWKQISYWQKL